MNPSTFFLVTKCLKSIHYATVRNCASSSQLKEPTVTILNASTKIGRNLALLLKQSPYVGELRLHDTNNNVCAVAEDLSHIDTKAKVKSFGGKTAMKHAILDVDVVVAVGGCRSSLSQTPKLLFEKNADDVRLITLHMVEFNPKAVLCLAKPPIEAMVPLVSQEYKKAGVYDSRKIIGITSMATMKANYYVAAASGKNPANILCPIVGGVSSNCLVGVLSQAKPNLGDNHIKVQNSLANSEDDVLRQYADCGTICFSPALAISRFINLLLRALMGDTNCVDCAFVGQTGHIGQFLPYMASIVRLGRQGVMSSHMPRVNGDEAHRLKMASFFIRDLISLGESFVTGEIRPPIKFGLNLSKQSNKEQCIDRNLSVTKEAKAVQ
ncbi:uncharacterized protein LOC108914084 [Anoplophora glabripennis]|uniref:uncharacterized protein LOC108914084 n=1 Tax=Anoplophora glabripennis TaxID=217634 RepID=UPI0008750DC3|nr:uncharacterized protein LOC108914084 [Anoplophora glabripennis]